VDVVLKMEEERLQLLKQMKELGSQTRKTELDMAELESEKSSAVERANALSSELDQTNSKVAMAQQELLGLKEAYQAHKEREAAEPEGKENMRSRSNAKRATQATSKFGTQQKAKAHQQSTTKRQLKF
jgi:hypothetical protein